MAPDGPLISTGIEMSRAAAVAGLGLILTFEDFLRPELASGALVAVLEAWTPDFSGPFLYYPSRTHMPGPLRAFIDFVKNT